MVTEAEAEAEAETGKVEVGKVEVGERRLPGARCLDAGRGAWKSSICSGLARRVCHRRYLRAGVEGGVGGRGEKKGGRGGEDALRWGEGA